MIIISSSSSTTTATTTNAIIISSSSSSSSSINVCVLLMLFLGIVASLAASVPRRSRCSCASSEQHAKAIIIDSICYY